MKTMKLFFAILLLTTTLANPAIAAKLIPSVPGTSSPSEQAAPTQPIRSAAPAPVATTPVRPVQAAAPAQTSPPARPTQPAASSSAFYLGAQVGDSTIGAMLGYQFSKMYAMEISYDYVDPVRTSTATGKTSLEVSRVGASGLAMFPIKFNEMGPMAIFIKVGYARTTEVYTVNDYGNPPLLPATTSVTTTLKTGVTGGAGVMVDLSTNTTARLGVNYVGGDRSVFLAALYKF